MATDYHLRWSGNMHVKVSTTGYTYGKLHDIAWYNENSNGEIHDVGPKRTECMGTL